MAMLVNHLISLRLLFCQVRWRFGSGSSCQFNTRFKPYQ